MRRLMAERRLTNSELRLRRLTEEEVDSEPRGILEIFGDDEQAEETSPLARDDEHTRKKRVASSRLIRVSGGASARRQAAWLQVLPGPGRDPPRGGRRRDRWAEPLREVQRLRRDPLGRRLPQPDRAAGREAGRRPLRRRGLPAAPRPLARRSAS